MDDSNKQTKDKIDEIINRFFELEEQVERNFEQNNEDIHDVESNMQKLMEIQTQQMDRINKNLELMNSILGEMSASLCRGE